MNPDFLEAEDYYTGPPLTDEMVVAAELALGVRLPAAYVQLLRVRNGGVPRARSFATPFATSWAPDHIEIEGILGVGGSRGIDAPLGSRYLIPEWGYPDIGVVVCDTPSAGHDTVMLDYRECGPRGEPGVVHVDEDRLPRRLAPSFQGFLAGLVVWPEDRGVSAGS